MTIVKVTENGEITFNTETKLYTAWEPDYINEICVTSYLEVAHAALRAYVEYYI